MGKKASPFEFLQSKEYATLKLTGDLPPEAVKEFEKEVSNFKDSPRFLVVDCEQLSTISAPWLRSILLLSKDLKAANKDIRYLSLSGPVSVYLKEQGVLNAFQVAKTFRSALLDFGIVTPRVLDVGFINPFLDATIHVLNVQASIEVKPGQVYRKSASDKFSGDISGVIGLVSDSFSGAVVISFPEATFLKIMSKMLGENYTSITQEISDGAAEMTNIIFGQAKMELNKTGYGIKTAIPSLVTGKDHSIQSMTRGPRVAIPFESEAGGFVVEICLSE